MHGLLVAERIFEEILHPEEEECKELITHLYFGFACDILPVLHNPGCPFKMLSEDPPALLPPGQTSPEVQNSGINGPTKRTYVLQKFKKKK